MASRIFARVGLNGGYQLGVLRRAEIREHTGMHALAILDFPVPRVSRRLFPPERTPLTLKWGTNVLNVQTFYGYVNHHEILDGEGTSILRVFCLGTSMPLNEPQPSAWNRVTGSYIARTIAERHNLRAVVHNTKETLPYWTQGVESDFEMMRRLSQRTGSRFWVDGSTLYFVDPQRLLRIPQGPQMPVLTMAKAGDIESIHLIAGSLAPRLDEPGPAVREIYLLDNNTGGLIRSTSAKSLADRGLNPPEHSEIIRTEIAHSPLDARRITEAASIRGNWVTVQAVTSAHPEIKVGDVAALRGDLLHPNYRGQWLVDGTTNVIVPKDRITTSVELSRQQAAQPVLIGPPGTQAAPRTVPAVLRNKHWESQLLETVYV